MTTSTQIKLSPAMVTALMGAKLVEGDHPRVSDDTKSQTVKGLATRGLSDLAGYLSVEGVEAAFQLGNDVRLPQMPATEPVVELTDDVELDQQAAEIESIENLLKGDPWTETEVTAPPVIESTPIGHDFGTTTPETNVPTIDAGLSAQITKLVDTPVVVPNREDKRKVKFSLKAAASRLFQRNKQRRINKYGTTKYGEVTS